MHESGLDLQSVLRRAVRTPADCEVGNTAAGAIQREGGRPQERGTAGRHAAARRMRCARHMVTWRGRGRQSRQCRFEVAGGAMGAWCALAHVSLPAEPPHLCVRLVAVSVSGNKGSNWQQDPDSAYHLCHAACCPGGCACRSLSVPLVPAGSKNQLALRLSAVGTRSCAR